MARKILFLFLAILFCLPALSQAGFFTDNRIKKANALIDIKRYNAAQSKLEEAILDKPADPEIHYLAALAYARIGYGNKVDECFDNVYRLGASEYFKKVQDYYQNLAYATVKQGGLEETVHDFKRSILFGFSRKMLIGNLMSFGNDYAKNNYFGDAYRYFRVAYALDRSVGNRISDVYFNACEKSSKPCFNFFRHAHEFSSKYDNEIVQILLVLYKTKGIAAHHKADIKEEIKFYVSNQTFKKLFPPPPPDYKIYPPGTYTFSLKAGEKTDHWIMFPAGRNNKYYLSSTDYNYKLIYNDGDVIKDGKNVHYPQKSRAKFKIIANTNQPKIKLVVR